MRRWLRRRVSSWFRWARWLGLWSRRGFLNVTIFEVVVAPKPHSPKSILEEPVEIDNEWEAQEEEESEEEMDEEAEDDDTEEFEETEECCLLILSSISKSEPELGSEVVATSVFPDGDMGSRVAAVEASSGQPE